MKLFQLVRRGQQSCGLKDIPKLPFQAYCLEDDACITEFIHALGIDTLHTEGVLLKDRYNPLLIKQNLFLISGDICYEVPYLLIRHQDSLSLMAQMIASMTDERQKNIFITVLHYIFTKDFLYLRRLIESRASFNLSLFAALNQAVSINGFYPHAFDEAISVLQGKLPDVSPIYSRYLAGKKQAEQMNLTLYNKIKNTAPKKNIILLHLESLSQEVYHNQLHNLPVLRELMNRSLVLNRFFSSASSSCMALTDLFFGNDFENDSFIQFDQMCFSQTHQKNLYAILQEHGYDVAGIGCKQTDTEEINQFHLWTPKAQIYQWHYTCQEMIEQVQQFIAQARRPFAMHIWDLMTHLGHKDTDTRKGSTYIERMDISYASLDMTVQAVLDALAQKGILEDTVIIGYGDHGDDKWTRSMNYGCTHITAPHLNVIHTPAFIYDARIGAGLYNHPVSTVDIKNTALFLAGITSQEAFPHGGINIFAKENEYVYSRSLFANQQETSVIQADWVSRLNQFSPLEHKNKSYCVINQHYNMLVGKHGLEFYMHQSDPGNYNNLLHFFEMDEAGDIVRFNNRGAWRGHFRTLLMADDQIFDILTNYYALRKALIERIELKQSLIRGDEKNFLPMTLFNQTAPRGFLWS